MKKNLSERVKESWGKTKTEVKLAGWIVILCGVAIMQHKQIYQLLGFIRDLAENQNRIINNQTEMANYVNSLLVDNRLQKEFDNELVRCLENITNRMN